jgi:hypothetical protein
MLSESPAEAFPLNAVLETFTGTDNTSPPNSNWTNAEIKNGDAAGGLDIQSNAVAPSVTGGTYGGYYNAQTFGPDAEAYFTVVNIGSTSFFAACVRITTPGNNTADGYCVEGQDAAGEVYTYRLDNGVATLLATYTQSITTTDKIGIQAIGNQICAWFSDNGGAWTSLGCSTDSTYSAAGYLALYIVGSTTVGGMDDFGGGTIVASTQMRRRLMQ